MTSHASDGGRAARIRALLTLAVLALAMLARLAGCNGAGQRPAPDVAEVAPPFEPQWESAVAAQRRRVANLSPLYASGQVELRSEKEGFEYCRGELFARPPAEAALSLTKVGERFLWLGGDGVRRWLFDLRGDEPVLWVSEPGGEPPPGAASAMPPGMERVSMIDLLGLMDLPPAEELDAVLEPQEGLLAVEFMAEGGAVRVFVDPATSLPVRVEALDDDGGLLLTSSLEEYERVEREGLPPGGLPHFPTRVVVTTADGADEVRLFLTAPENGQERVKDRLFDLDALIRTFKPARVERW